MGLGAVGDVGGRVTVVVGHGVWLRVGVSTGSSQGWGVGRGGRMWTGWSAGGRVGVGAAPFLDAYLQGGGHRGVPIRVDMGG